VLAVQPIQMLGHAIDFGGVGAMLGLCSVCGVVGILCAAVSCRAAAKTH